MRTWSFFLLTLSSLIFFLLLFSSLTLPISAFHLSILSEAGCENIQDTSVSVGLHTVLNTACSMWLGTVRPIINNSGASFGKTISPSSRTFQCRLHKAIPESITSRISTRIGLIKPTPSRCPLAFPILILMGMFDVNQMGSMASWWNKPHGDAVQPSELTTCQGTSCWASYVSAEVFQGEGGCIWKWGYITSFHGRWIGTWQ